MRFLSLFSGIEAASIAWKPLGWECVAFSEIEPFPCAVLAHPYPNTPNLGDVTKITEDDIKNLGQIGLVVFGFPCQDLSIAGARKGFEGERSSLFYDAIRVINYAKQHCGTRFALLENVPGAFSSNKGADFTEVVKHMAGLSDLDTPANGWGKEGAAVGDNGLLEWCVLDAQWFRLAQRRKRVFAIVDFGDWASRPPILLERESLRGSPAPSREAQQEVAGTLSSRTSGGGGLGADFECAGGLQPVDTYQNVSHCLNAGGMGRIDYESESFVFHGTMAVRRLTPVECERLQGFPDNFTRIPWRGKEPENCPDGPRYKALGNSMAVPCMKWIGERIQRLEDIQ